jgi:ubiquinone/menaquinone biosynthesis C-methylase UbiE
MMISPRAVIHDRLCMLRCPDCGGPLLEGADDGLNCSSCRTDFPFMSRGELATIRLMPQAISATKQHIRAFWGDLYQQWHGGADSSQTEAQLCSDLESLEELFRRRRHLAVTEMDVSRLQGKHVCEIGSGAGAHSALFRRHGAHVTAVDITPERVFATAHKLMQLQSIVPGSGLAVQADAEKLPFADSTFDIVYSNGVLHHTENTETAIGEVLRVLKPGGEGVLMLYSRHSALFWAKLLPRAVVTGAVFRYSEPHWLGRITEGRPAYGSQSNPITRVYSARQVTALLRRFASVKLRKSSCQFGHFFPKGDPIRNRVLQALGMKPHPAGSLIYGGLFYPETAMEMWLGPRCGFAWNIVARK